MVHQALVVTFESVGEILKYDLSNNNCRTALFCVGFRSSICCCYLLKFLLSGSERVNIVQCGN